MSSSPPAGLQTYFISLYLLFFPFPVSHPYLASMQFPAVLCPGVIPSVFICKGETIEETPQGFEAQTESLVAGHLQQVSPHLPSTFSP